MYAWLRVQGSNLLQQGQSLLCYRYTNPQCLVGKVGFEHHKGLATSCGLTIRCL